MGDVLKPEGNYLRSVNLAKISSFDELRKEGFTPLALGPMYVYAGVRLSLINAYASEKTQLHPSDCFTTTMHFDRPVIARCEEWNYMLDIMDTASFQWFKKWMLGMQFVDKATKRFNIPRHYVVPMLDPIQLDTKNIAVPTTLDVFSVSGRAMLLKPITGVSPINAPICVDFVQAPPEEDIQVLANKVLNIVRES